VRAAGRGGREGRGGGGGGGGFAVCGKKAERTNGKVETEAAL